MQFLAQRFFRLINCFFLMILLTSSSVQLQAQAQIKLTHPSPEKDTSSAALKFLSSFANTELPYQTEDEYNIKDTIPADFVIHHILEASSQVAPEVFKDLWENEEMQAITIKGLKDRYINVEKNAFAVINFGSLHKLNISEDFQTIIFKYIPTFMEGAYSFTFLANYDTDGNLIDVVRIGGFAGYVDMQNKWSATVNKSGKIEVYGKAVKKGQMFGEKEDFIETSELSYQLDKDGKIILTKQKYSSFSGSFIRQSNEEILHIEEFFDQINIIYQPSPDNFSEQELDVIKIDKKKNQIITQFPDSPEQVVITYNSDRTKFICKNESGDKWEYTRTEF